MCSKQASSSSDPTKRFSIADVIQEVREQLREAERRVRESGAKGLFKGRDFELTLHFGIVDSTEVKGELDIVLAKLGAKKTYIDETAQTIRITFDIDPSLNPTR